MIFTEEKKQRLKYLKRKYYLIELKKYIEIHLPILAASTPFKTNNIIDCAKKLKKCGNDLTTSNDLTTMQLYR